MVVFFISLMDRPLSDIWVYIFSRIGGGLNETARSIKVWDLGVRVFHWALVVAVAGCLLSGYFVSRPWLDLHIVTSSIVIALLVFRMVWGFLGTSYARFSQFFPSPLGVLRHAAKLARGAAPFHVGHNPLGAAMIVALLLLLLALSVSGIVILGGVLKEGPASPFLSFSAGQVGAQVHMLGSYGLMVLIALHLFGVAVESKRENVNLVAAMVSGHKPAGLGVVATNQVASRPLLATVIIAIIAIPCVLITIYYSMQPAFGVPREPMKPLYAAECSDCHTAHHPSLAPKSTWSAIMLGLDDHFGENASLEPEDQTILTAYLIANASARWDTQAANLFRVIGRGKDILRITGTPGWREIHSEIAGSVFADKSVGGKLNCSKCHRDAATGIFAPRAINVPRKAIQKGIK